MSLVNISRTPLIERTQWDTIEREVVIANVHMMQCGNCECTDQCLVIEMANDRCYYINQVSIS